MGWWKKITGGIKKIFKGVTKVVKKIVGKISDVGKKIWGGVKKFAGKAGKIFTKLGPIANLAMNFIPGFGQLWQAYGVWGQMAKGAITGYLTSGGNVKGALLGAAGAAAGDWYSKLEGNGLSEKMTNTFGLDKGTNNFIDSLKKTFKSPEAFKGYTGRIGVDTTNLPPSMRGQYEYSAPSLASIQGAYDANLANGGTRDKILENFNAQAARDAAYWAEINPPKKNPLKLPEGFSFGNNDGGVAGYFAGDTSPLTAYNTATGRTQGQIGTGTDNYDVTQIGLLEMSKKLEDSRRVFQT